jgi:hypothetical protein
MIDNDFSAVSTEQLLSIIQMAEDTLSEISSQLYKLNGMDQKNREQMTQQYIELTTWFSQAQCELFERLHH